VLLAVVPQVSDLKCCQLNCVLFIQQEYWEAGRQAWSHAQHAAFRGVLFSVHDMSAGSLLPFLHSKPPAATAGIKCAMSAVFW